MSAPRDCRSGLDGRGDLPATAARIHSLDATLANQIAAGEVVERPASVLKELLENSIDAGAGRLRVDVTRGGLAMVRVTDDGAGIHVNDLALALERHATSKIATLEQLEAVRSMGFRGEALPSIASVSRLRIESRAGGAEEAWAVSAEGGPVLAPPAPVAHPIGTTVTMQDLFFNTPVRRRFLRAPRTELRHLDRVFRRAALAAFPVAMSFSHDGRELLRLAGAGDETARLRRVGRVLGAKFADAGVAVDAGGAGLRLWGWVASPELGRERSDMQHLYVNGRAVVDATVRHAVRLAFGDLLADSAQPAWLLYLELDPREVDVNVHPAKHEVRFRESRMVHDFVRSAVRAALEQRHFKVSAAAPRGHGGAQERRDAYAAQPPIRPLDDSAPRLLALLDGGLVLARRGGQALLACGPELRRARVTHELDGALARGTQVVTRPLLIPERLALTCGEVPVRALVDGLAALGFELRISAPDAAVLLSVPDVLARVPVRDLVTVLCRGQAACLEKAAWVPLLATLAASTPVDDPGEAQLLLDALHRAGVQAPWVVLDVGAVARLVAARG